SYRSEAMNYFQYARRWKQDNYFTEEKRQDIRNTLQSFKNYDLIVSTLLDVDYFSKRQFGEMLDMEKSDLEKLWALFMKYRLVSTASGGRGYKKSVAFTRFLKQLGSSASGYEAQPSSAPAPQPHWSSRDD